MINKFTHVKCLEDVIENDVVIFKSGEIYRIVEFEWKSLLYCVEPEFYENNLLPDEFVIYMSDKRFEFLCS